MGKLLVFYLLWRLTGNPILAIIVLLVIYYFVDRRYIGLLPNIFTPFRRMTRISRLKTQLRLNPHDMPARQDLAEAYLETRRYRDALKILDAVTGPMIDAPDIKYDKGLCYLGLGQLESGEALVLEALAMDNRLRYGDPYLKLATAFADTDPTKALIYIQSFQQLNVSSCESYYRTGVIQRRLGDLAAAKEAWRACLDTYRSLPAFRKRRERRWALLARFRLFG